jgi:5-carboxymethyl-2-hydroxymuconate isomerase
MPHLVILYTRPLEDKLDMSALCRSAADAMLSIRDEIGAQVFPTGGTRVLAYPSAHHAVADGRRPYDFLYLNLRMARGRSAAVHQAIGEAVLAAVRAHVDPPMAEHYIGITLQIDEGTEVFDAKHSTIHPLFGGPAKKG